MVNQDLLTIFVTITTLAVLIQTGIIVGLYMVSRKLSEQADRAVAQVRGFEKPIERITETLQTASARIAQFSASTQGRLKEAELQLDRTLQNFRRRIA